MVIAYVLIATNQDTSKVANDLTVLEKIENIHLIYGEYDIIGMIRAENMIKLRNFCVHELPKVHGISKTTTLIVASEE